MSSVPPGQGGAPAGPGGGQGGMGGQPANPSPPGHQPPPQPPYPNQPPQPPYPNQAPQQPPYPNQPPVAPPAAPAGPAGPAVASGGGHGAFRAEPAAKKRSLKPEWLDMKAGIAILIGLVSFSGALLTWKAANLSSNATGADRQSILETVVKQQNVVSVETQLRFEQIGFARFKTDMVNAIKLRAEADQLRKGGDADAARQLEDEANRVQNLAFVAVRDVNGTYISYDDKGVPQFDENARRLSLEHADEAASQANPGQQATFADHTRSRSQRLVSFLPIFVFAIALLTIAQLMQRDAVRPYLAGAGTAIWVIALVIALVGDKA